MGRRAVWLIGFVLLAVVLAGVCATAWGQGQIRLVVNGREVQSDVPPQIIGGRTMVPLRAVAEALGADVKWDDAKQAVYVSGGKDKAALELLSKYNATLGYLQWIESYFNGPDLILDRQAAFIAAGMPTTVVSPLWKELALQWLEDYISMAWNYGNNYLESDIAKMTWEAMGSAAPEFVIPKARLKALVEESMTLHANIGLHLSKVLAAGVATEEDRITTTRMKNRWTAVRNEAYALLKETSEATTDKHIRLVDAIYQNQ